MTEVKMRDFEWREGTSHKGIDPEVAGQILAKIADRDGEITTEAVLKEATKKRSPLKAWFTWDNTAAAERWRLYEARKLIQSVRVRIVGDDDEERTIRAFVHLGTPGSREEGFDTISRILSEPERRAKLLANAFVELEQFQNKYRDLKELSDIFAALDEAVA